MKILVTGARGFIGSHLCRHLMSGGHEVHGISREAHPKASGGLRWWQGDVADEKMVSEIVGSIRPQIIFHLAGRVTGSRDPREIRPIFEANLASSVNIMTSALHYGCARVVLAGSSEEPVGDADAVPCSPYAAAKVAATSYARMFRALFHQEVVVPRIFMVYGPGQWDVQKLVPYTILSLLGGQSPKLSSGNRLVDWIYIDDVVDGLQRTAFSPSLPAITFDLGSGVLVPIREIVEQITELIGNGVRPEFGAIPERRFEPQRAADTNFAEDALGWKPRTSLREGLAKTIEWYRSATHLGPLVASIVWAISGFFAELAGPPHVAWLS